MTVTRSDIVTVQTEYDRLKHRRDMLAGLLLETDMMLEQLALERVTLERMYERQQN